jgi:PKD repeat protein/Tol biopolymer transport system component
MNRIRLPGSGVAVCAGLGMLALLSCLAAPAPAAITERVSVSGAAEQSILGGYTEGKSLSADGRYVVFTSYATDLVPVETNGRQAYLRDRLYGLTELVSVSSSGEPAYHSWWGAVTQVHGVSDDGRYVVFSSLCDNLVPGDTNEAHDIFVRDRLEGTTERVSVSSAEEQANFHGMEAAISGDGRYVAFSSGAYNLVPGDTNGYGDIFVRDRVAGTTEIVSISSDGSLANGPSGGPHLSPDGRYVTYSSYATNLVPGDTNGEQDAFVHDRLTGTTELVSLSATGQQGNMTSGAGAISSDGRYVLFGSWAAMVPGVCEDYAALYLRDRLLGATEMVSLDGAGQQAEGVARNDGMSANGRFVPFDAEDADLLPGYSDLRRKACVRDRWAGTTELAAANTNGEPANDTTERYDISATGRYVAFTSSASNLVNGDSNDHYDAFVRDRCNGAPVADFSADVTTLPATWPVTFTDRSEDFPSAWSWNFGDGASSLEWNPIHAYVAPGVYTVSLTVQNEYGSDSETKPDYITVTDPVGAAGFSVSARRGLVPLEVDFMDDSFGAPTSWLWNFGDGDTSTNQHPTHSYTRVGNFTLTLTARGPWGTVTKSVPRGVRVTFSDLPLAPKQWALDYIFACAQADLVGGYEDGTYRPDLPVTRDAMAVYIARALAGGDAAVPVGPSTATFTDMPTDHWAYRYVEYAVDQGVVGGYGSLYRPTVTVTRDAMAVFVARAMCGGESGLPSAPPTAFFSDVPTDHWAFRYVEYCHDEGVVGGYGDGTYRPLLAVTRDAMAVYVQRAFDLPM